MSRPSGTLLAQLTLADARDRRNAVARGECDLLGIDRDLLHRDAARCRAAACGRCGSQDRSSPPRAASAGTAARRRAAASTATPDRSRARRAARNDDRRRRSAGESVLSALTTSARLARSAGASPKTMPVSSVIASVNHEHAVVRRQVQRYRNRNLRRRSDRHEGACPPRRRPPFRRCRLTRRAARSRSASAR